MIKSNLHEVYQLFSSWQGYTLVLFSTVWILIRCFINMYTRHFAFSCAILGDILIFDMSVEIVQLRFSIVVFISLKLLIGLIDYARHTACTVVVLQLRWYRTTFKVTLIYFQCIIVLENL